MSTRESTRDAVVSTTTTTTREGYYWERRRAGALPWVLGAVGLLGLGLAHDIPNRHSIEGKLESSSRAALDAAGADGVDIDFTGRDGLLTGTLPAGVTADDLIGRLEGLDGVRVVRADFAGSGQAGTGGDATPDATPSANGGSTSEPSTNASTGASADTSPTSEPSVSVAATSGQLPSVQLAATGSKVTLTGAVPSQQAIDALVAAATTKYGAGNVVSQLTVDDSLTDTGLGALAGMVAALGATDPVIVDLSQGRLTLSGTVSSDAAKAAVEAAATAVTGDAAKVTSQLTVAGSGSGTGSPGAGDKGAVQQQLAKLPMITFVTGSSQLTSRGRQEVRKVAAVLKANPSIKVRIEGHTDDVGNATANQALSTERAKMVRTTLFSLGITHDRMSYVGYGESRPKVPNTSAGNRLANRRVEFRVL